MEKPHKTDQPASAPAAKPDARLAAAGSLSVRHVDANTFRRAADKVLQTHGELLRRLSR